ncbi:MAG: DUF4149 domain-containing protein [Halobacteriales archaeon]|nr:DUF4149 domain-containing protein [Halobacteriales archaeon]
MSALTAALSLVVHVALAAWLGIMAFFSFVGAPRAFAVFGDEGGAYVNDVFPRYYRMGIGLGAVAAAAALALGATAGFDLAGWVLVAGAALSALLPGYSLAVLIPKMEAAGDDAFEQYHRQSVLLNGLAMLAAAVGVVAAHWPA